MQSSTPIKFLQSPVDRRYKWISQLSLLFNALAGQLDHRTEVECSSISFMQEISFIVQKVPELVLVCSESNLLKVKMSDHLASISIVAVVDVPSPFLLPYPLQARGRDSPFPYGTPNGFKQRLRDLLRNEAAT